jgi:hypothetical protein
VPGGVAGRPALLCYHIWRIDVKRKMLLALLAPVLSLAAADPPEGWPWPNCDYEEDWSVGCANPAAISIATKDSDCVGWVDGIGAPCIISGSSVCWDENIFFVGPDIQHPWIDPNDFVQEDHDQDHDVDMHDVAWWQVWWTGIHWVVWEDGQWVEVE